MHCGGVVVEAIPVGGCSDVAALVEVASELSIDTADHYIVANVELPALIEQRTVDIGLNEKSLQCSIGVGLFLFDDRLDLRKVLTVPDAITPIRKLSRLHNPARLALGLAPPIVLTQKP